MLFPNISPFVLLSSCLMESPTTLTPTRTVWPNSRSTFTCSPCSSASSAWFTTSATTTVLDWTLYLQRWDMFTFYQKSLFIWAWRTIQQSDHWFSSTVIGRAPSAVGEDVVNGQKKNLMNRKGAPNVSLAITRLPRADSAYLCPTVAPIDPLIISGIIIVMVCQCNSLN